MNYQEATAYLDQLQFFKIKLGLETTKSLLAQIGTPQNHFKIIHIAGTNGKGSVGATLLSVLTAAGYKTGFYSSPHLFSVRERFRIGPNLISEANFAQLVGTLKDVLAGQDPPTYFEFTTLLALLWFKEAGVEIALLETGMGGRLDATNVVTPVLSIITDISLDHEQYLGSTLPEIAQEKAGIIKKGVPVVFSGRAPETVPTIQQRCAYTDSPLFLYGQHFSGSRNADGRLDYLSAQGTSCSNLPLRLAGEHQVVNTCLALAAVELLHPTFPVSSQALVAGLQHVRWPGRMELINHSALGKTIRILLDGAHNEAGANALLHSLQHQYPRKRLLLVWGNMEDKKLGASLADMVQLADKVILTQAESLRSASPSSLYAQVPPAHRSKVRCVTSPEQAIDEAIAFADSDDVICVAGSLYLVGKIRHILLQEISS